jgi:hypothetical protein
MIILLLKETLDKENKKTLQEPPDKKSLKGKLDWAEPEVKQTGTRKHWICAIPDGADKHQHKASTQAWGPLVQFVTFIPFAPHYISSRSSDPLPIETNRILEESDSLYHRDSPWIKRYQIQNSFQA